MKNTIFQALPIVAGHYAKMVNVPVKIVGASTACTDGETIWIPNDSREETWGYLIHEAAHCRYSDFKFLELGPFEKHINNVFEDIFIEMKIMKEFSGTRIDLEFLAETVKKQGGFTAPRKDDHIADIVADVIRYHGFSVVRGFSGFDDFYKTTLKIARKVIPSHVDALLDIVHQSHNMMSSADALKLTYRVSELFGCREEENPEQNSEPGDQDGDGDDGQSQQQQSGNSSKNDSSNDSTDRSGNGSGTESDIEETEGGLEGDQSAVGAGSWKQQSIATDPDITDKLLDVDERELKPDRYDQMRNEIQQQQENFLVDVQNGQIPRPDEIVIGKLPTSQPANLIPSSFVHEATVKSRRLAQELEQSLSVFKKGKTSIHSSGRRVSSKRIPRVIFGESDIFTRRKNLRQTVDASIVLLVDMSDSMDFSFYVNDVREFRFRIANSAALTLALALDSIDGVSLAVNFFSRTSTSTVTCAKSFDQPAKSVVDHFWQMPCGSTPMASAMWAAVSQLADQQSTRKLIVCVTDGQPDNPTQTKKVIDDSINSGIEVIGVGIQTDVVKYLFKDHVVIDDASQLAGSLFAVVEQTLTKVA